MEAEPLLGRCVAAKLLCAARADDNDSVGMYFLGLSGLAASASPAGAVLLQGTVVVDSMSANCSTPWEAWFGEIRVRDGDRVEPATS